MNTITKTSTSITETSTSFSSSFDVINRLHNDIWSIRFYDNNIQTTVTSRASKVDNWIHKTMSIHYDRLHELVIGLDTEWCLPSKKVAIIQLCVGHRCLIFQLCHRDAMPQSLVTFLGNNKFTFVGKAVETDAKKLLEDYDLNVARVGDVADMAATKYQDEELRRSGLMTLALKYLNVEIDKSKRIILSKWDRKKLSKEQIQYAAIDAFVSFQLGIKLK